MVADIFTKAVSPQKLEHLTNKVRLIDYFHYGGNNTKMVKSVLPFREIVENGMETSFFTLVINFVFVYIFIAIILV